MSAPSEWRSNLTRLRRSYHARLGAFGAVFAIAIAACEPQCAPAPAPAPAPGPAPAAAPPPAPPGGGGSQVPAPTGGQFYEDFSSPDSVGRFDVQLHSGTTGTELQPLEPQWEGDHNHACEGPETKRTIFGGDVRQLDPRSLTWYCAPRGAESGHFMTSVDTGSVVVLGFSPNQVFSNISQVCWDVNATNLGEGKWINMVVVPESVFQANGRRLDYSSDPDLDPSSLRLPSQSLLIKEFRGAIISAWNGYNQTMWEGGPDDITDDPRRATPAVCRTWATARCG